jgi:hypothetical protein
MKNLLVTLLSDQTVPNVQFIKEKQNNDTVFLFISTPKMEGKGVLKCIQKVCNIEEDKIITKVVDQFSLSNIETKLNELNFDEYEKITVNVTGGTKIMSHTATEFFKELGAEIYYLTGAGNSMLQVYPRKRQSLQTISNQISLKEYIECHGFVMREGSLSGIVFDYSQTFLQKFLNFGDNEWRIINELREQRGRAVLIEDINGLQDLLCNVEFPLNDQNYLNVSKKEVKHLTGDWFEEYIYYRLKQEFVINDEDIKTGITLTKDNSTNEFDVVFLWKGTLYTIECKTSIIGNDNENILNETIYKSTALQKNLGLFTKSSIFTLSSKDGREVRENHIDRAKVFGVQVFCREDILNCQSISQLLSLSL